MKILKMFDFENVKNLYTKGYNISMKNTNYEESC